MTRLASLVFFALIFTATPLALGAGDPSAPAAPGILPKALPIAGEGFSVEGHAAFLILPEHAAVGNGMPWVWYAPTLPGLPGAEERWMFQKFLEAGIAVAGIDVGESYGSPKGRALFSTFYEELVGKRGLSKKPCLLARSRGGLMLYNWAVEHPSSVAGVAGVYPVCNLASYPGIKQACGAYGLTEEQLNTHLAEHNPCDRLEPLARAHVPIYHLHGDSDTVVPLEANSGEMARRYGQWGGEMTLNVIKGRGHDMWPGWFQCQELVDFVLRASRSALGAVPPAASVAAAPALKEIVIVYKTHFDIGYTQLARDVCHQYRTEMADKVLEAIARNASQPKEKQFVWTVSGYPMSQMLGPEQAPERREQISGALRSGNLAVHALAFSMHDETFEPEDLVRSLGWSSAIAREHGLPLPRDAKTTDVPGHSWILPTLLTHAGVKFFQMGGPLVNRSFSLPNLFWWEGPDGSRLLTHYRNDYGTERMPPKDWPSSAWLFLHMTADNEGPPPPNVVEADLKFYREQAPGVKVRVGRLEDFADLVLAEKPALPVVRSDLPDPWIHGLLSHPDTTRLAHNLRPSFPALDALTTLENAWGVYRPSVRAALAEAYRNSALYSEHTWGLATQHYIRQLHGQPWEEMLVRGWSPVYETLEEANREHDDYITRARLAVENPLADALASLADHVNLGGPRVVVFNPLPWARDGLVRVNANAFPTANGVRDAGIQGRAPVARSDGVALEGPPKIVTFVAKDVPPMGYRTYVFEDLPAGEPGPALAMDEASRTIESPWFKAVFDPENGRITSLVDKRAGRELVDANAPQGFGQYFYERFGRKDVIDYLDTAIYPQYTAHRNIMAKGDLPESTYQSGLPKNLKLRFEKSPIAVSAVMSGTLPGPGPAQTVACRLTLYADLPVADLEVRCQKPLDAWPEAGWICLPIKLERPAFRLGKLGGDLDFARDINVDWCNRRLLWLHTGAAVYEPSGYGVGVCPLDSPLVSLGEPGLYRAGATYQPKSARLYVNLYNNKWQTNFRNWTGGDLVSRVRLWTFDQFQSEPALYTPAMEARVPLRVARSHQPAGRLPVSQSGLSLSRKGVMVTAFGEDPDGNPGTLLRLWEQGGVGGALTVTLPAGLKATKALPVNLRGDKAGPPIRITDRSLIFNLAAYAPASFIIQ